MKANLLIGFGRRLAAVRHAYAEQIGRVDFSQAKMAAALGIKTATYSRYERGETEPPLALLVAVRKLTRISLDYLVADEDKGIQKPEQMFQVCIAPFVERLAMARKRCDYSVKRAAQELQVSERTFSRWESGQDLMPEAMMESAANAFGVSIAFLVHGLLDELPKDVRAQFLQAHPEAWKMIDRHDLDAEETNIVPLHLTA